ncbi:hypothetical protein [Lachnobacterium bovis]|uniref:Uncharacterized protein n=1 Tax=Lachnobacterium bovis DSM 14045 TaxID=1122142 RepID=A0A1H3JNF2_9FIRM|nr:hypothetical protein [Lachnobacterium bovis]MBQ1802126.1 transglycosylase [Lachnobacterium sp.]SDY41446.1 hypothetical protein SAMN02910414_01509 [Lachnobacterium bovis DSM 14045]
MNKRDMTKFDIFVEIVCGILLMVSVSLQVIYSVLHSLSIFSLIINVLIVVLVYIGLSMLSCYPEKVNAIPQEICIGNIRRYSIKMIRYAKLIFVASLVVPEVCDLLEHTLGQWYSFVVVVLIVGEIIYYEIKIIKLIRLIKK